MAGGNVEIDHGRSWMIAACCCFCNMTFYGMSRLSGIMLVAATHTFQVSRASAAVPFSLSTAIRNLAGIFVGHLGHRFGVGPVVAVGCLIASLGSGLCFFAKDIQWITVCWGGVFGIGFGLCTCLLPLAINQNFAKHNGTASGISYSGSYIGSFIFPPVIIMLLDTYGFQGTFLIISGGVLHVFVAAILLGKSNSAKRCLQGRISISGAERNGGGIGERYNRQQRLDGDSRSFLSKNIGRYFNKSQVNIMDVGNYKRNSNSVPFVCCSSSSNNTIKCSPELQDISKRNSKNASLFCIKANSAERLGSEVLRNFRFDPTPAIYQKSENNSTMYNSSGPLFASSDPFIHLKELVLNEKNQSQYSCINEISSIDRIEKSANETYTVPKASSNKFNLEWKPISKGKLKAKCKFRLQKLKKVLVTSLLNRSYAKRELLNTNNVQLLSFRHYQTLRCPSLPKTSVQNDHTFFSPPNDISNVTNNIPQNKESNSRFKNKLVDKSFSLPNHTENNYITSGFRGTHEPETEISCLQKSCQNTDKFSVIRSSYEYINPNQISLVAKENHTNSLCEAVRNYEHRCPSFNEREEDISSNKYTFNVTNTKCDKGCSIPTISEHVKSVEFKSSDNIVHSSHYLPNIKNTKKSFPDWFRMLCEPMFIVISFTMSIQTFIVVCVVTTIEDYAKDVGISESRGHYALMALSTANLIGTLTLGAITDRGFISRHRFISLCFFGMSLSLMAVSLVAVSLSSLLAVVVIYGLLESGVVITFPILTKQFVKGEKRQAVAIASSNALSAPTVMLVPMFIGHFRDNIGCYSGLFHLLAATSFTCSLIWLVAPSLCLKRRLKKIVIQQSYDNCKK